jgi:hypothetical protein
VPTSYFSLLPPPSSAPLTSPFSDTPENGRPSSPSSSISSIIPQSTGRSSLGKKGPAVAPKRGAKKLRYVEVLYDYTAVTDTEHDISVGERLVLIKGDAGDGWAEVEKGGVTRSVPAAYVREV